MSIVAIFVLVLCVVLPNLTNKYSYFGIALNSSIRNLVKRFEHYCTGVHYKYIYRMQFERHCLIDNVCTMFCNCWQATSYVLHVNESDPLSEIKQLILYSNLPITCQKPLEHRKDRSFLSCFMEFEIQLDTARDIAVRARYLGSNNTEAGKSCYYKLDEGDWNQNDGVAYNYEKPLQIIAKVGRSFLPRCMECMQTRSCDEISVCLSVRLSVRPSVKRVHCDKTEEKSVQIFIPCERSFSLVL